jgi:hypothetical protein
VAKATAPIGRKEARRAAQQRVYDGAVDLIAGLIDNRGGNYQGVKFLFEFAGLISDDFEEESSPEFLAIMQQFQRRTAPQADDAQQQVS